MTKVSPRKVRVIGAGFSGLLAAHYLRNRGFEVEVFEAEARSGGLLQTHRLPWGLAETAANGFLANLEIESVADAVGCELEPARRASRRRFFFRAGRARQWPFRFFEGVGVIVRLFFAWIFRFLAPIEGESVATWGRRVGGPAFVRWLLAPALSGIYAAAPERLSAPLLLRRFFGQKFKAPKRGRLRGLVAPRHGMGDFVAKLEASLRARDVAFRFGRGVTAAEAQGWAAAGGVVWAVPLPAAVDALTTLSPVLAAALGRVGRIGLVSVTAFFDPRPSDLRGFGCLFPRGEGVVALGALFNAEIFEGRGELRSETWIYSHADVPRDDAIVVEQLAADRLRLGGATKAAPLGVRVQRWPFALPVYDEALAAALARPEWASLERAGHYFVGNYRGSLGLSRLIGAVRATVEAIA